MGAFSPRFVFSPEAYAQRVLGSMLRNVRRYSRRKLSLSILLVCFPISAFLMLNGLMFLGFDNILVDTRKYLLKASVW